MLVDAIVGDAVVEDELLDEQGLAFTQVLID